MRFKAENSPFAILGIGEDANDEQVRTAYRTMGMRFHPDSNASPDAERMFKRIQMAYQMLKDADSRRQVVRILNIYRRVRSRQRDASVEQDLQRMRRASADEFYQAHGDSIVEQLSAATSGFWITLGLALLRSARLEQAPFKMLVFCPYMLGLNIHFAEDGLSQDLLLAAAWQGAAGAVCADLLAQAATTVERHTLRRYINWWTSRIVILSLVLLFYSIDVRGEAIFFFIGSNPVLIRTAVLLALCSALYLWLVLCFLFERHSPSWEVLMLMLGVAALQYVVFFII